MNKYQQNLQATQQLIDQSLMEKGFYQTTVLGEKFTASPKVFSPKYFKDTQIFARHLPIHPGEDFCEIGCGIGALAIFAALKGAKKVVAIDCNPEAVKITRINGRAHRANHLISVRKGSLFDSLKPEELFDSIFWNTPFGFVGKHKLSMLERAVFDPCYKNTERFIKEGPRHLKPGGRLLIGFSSTLGRLDLIKKFCEEAGLKLSLVYREKSEEILPVLFEIFEAHK